jgi:predicted DNA-binding protein
MGNRKQYNNLRVGLTTADCARLTELGKTLNRTQSEIARDAIRWYIENHENIAHDAREAEVAKAIKYATDQLVRAIKNGVDRICKMLSRQGIAIGTLYEITWMSLPDETAKKAFGQAMAQAKKRMQKHTEGDELALAEAMEKVVGAP